MLLLTQIDLPLSFAFLSSASPDTSCSFWAPGKLNPSATLKKGKKTKNNKPLGLSSAVLAKWIVLCAVTAHQCLLVVCMRHVRWGRRELDLPFSRACTWGSGEKNTLIWLWLYHEPLLDVWESVWERLHKCVWHWQFHRKTGSAAFWAAGVCYLRAREGEGCSAGEVIRLGDSRSHVVSDKSLNLLVPPFLIL